MTRRRRRTIALLAGLAFVSYAVLRWGLVPYRIRGGSMAPTLVGSAEAEVPSGGAPAGDVVIVNRLAYLLGEPGRWDVVVLRHSSGEESVKRIVGLPGEAVEIREGRLLVNGSPAGPPERLHDGRDDYIVRKGRFGHSPVKLGPREYFVLGDSSYLSQDSRRWGPIGREAIEGRVEWIIFPLARLGAVP